MCLRRGSRGVAGQGGSLSPPRPRHRRAAPAARPPRPSAELLDRRGAYEPRTALTWLAGHGCEGERELDDAEAVVLTYQDSPARAAMLATLRRLHRKP